MRRLYSLTKRKGMANFDRMNPVQPLTKGSTMKVDYAAIGRQMLHPVALKVLRMYEGADGKAISPKQMSVALGEPLGNVSYHISQLAGTHKKSRFKHALVLELVGTEPRRGAARSSTTTGWRRDEEPTRRPRLARPRADPVAGRADLRRADDRARHRLAGGRGDLRLDRLRNRAGHVRPEERESRMKSANRHTLIVLVALAILITAVSYLQTAPLPKCNLASCIGGGLPQSRPDLGIAAPRAKTAFFGCN